MRFPNSRQQDFAARDSAKRFRTSLVLRSLDTVRPGHGRQRLTENLLELDCRDCGVQPCGALKIRPKKDSLTQILLNEICPPPERHFKRQPLPQHGPHPTSSYFTSTALCWKGLALGHLGPTLNVGRLLCSHPSAGLKVAASICFTSACVSSNNRDWN